MIIHASKGYVTMPTDFLMYQNLSLKAKGVLAMAIALDDGNGVDTIAIYKHCKDEEPAICAAVFELQERGFLARSVKSVMLV